ncbi:ankyrin repeat-containing domain protein [Aspergillus pseudoustus]|uniref:Ankyrin repeat-containing domain protein n=1 Tax=Aspergillus pseudoustus TaxID=1810923 RepID=A0ABR4J6W1_9EURO
MALESFPTEILQQVGESASLPTLNALSRVNRRFHSIFNPLLYIQDARGQPASAGGAAAVRWAATHGLLRTLQNSFQGGSEVPPRAPWMRCAPDDTERTIYGLTVNKRFVDPVPPPHPLCLAVRGGHADVAEFLLDEKGCDVDMVDPERFSLLELAVIHGHVHLVEGLLRRGASQLLRSLVNGCPIQIAVELGRMDMVRLLWEYGSLRLWCGQGELIWAFGCAIKRRNMEALHTLLGYGVGVNIRFAQERNKSITALELAVEMEDVELVELLLASGACPRHTGSATGCALLRAVQHRNERMASLVIRSSSCMQKTMALAFAVEQEAGQMARFLLAHGTHPDFDDLEDSNVHRPKGYADTWHFASPLARAVNAGHEHLVRLLVESGADVNVPFEGFERSRSSRQSGSVLQLAMDLDHKEIVLFLRERAAKEELESYAYRVLRLSMEEAMAPNAGELRRKRLRRHMGLNGCTGSNPG